MKNLQYFSVTLLGWGGYDRYIDNDYRYISNFLTYVVRRKKQHKNNNDVGEQKLSNFVHY